MASRLQSLITWDLLDSLPASTDETMIVQWPNSSDRDLAFFYQQAATRIAASHKGQPIDDVILLPYLMLYRQAFELQLKSFTKYLAAMRRRYREPSNPGLVSKVVASKLRRPSEIGHHKMEPLLAELLSHYDPLDLSEPFPPGVEKCWLYCIKPTVLEPSSGTRETFHRNSRGSIFETSLNSLTASSTWSKALGLGG